MDTLLISVQVKGMEVAMSVRNLLPRLWRDERHPLSSLREEMDELFENWTKVDAAQNARLITNAERYYRMMYYVSRASWNLRDSHMFHTLKRVMHFHGPDAKAIVWAHNSYVGDATATEMSRRGEYNIGQLCRQYFGSECYLIGFGTNEGTVAAASAWDGPMQIMHVRPAHPQSYERLFTQQMRWP
jgi:protein-L-isoaspartate(D-aspartate) O-methyltransferase